MFPGYSPDSPSTEAPFETASAGGQQDDARTLFFKTFKELKRRARSFMGDHSTEVTIGVPGGGSYINLEDRSITFDPLHIADDPEIAEFIAMHEAMHGWITLGPKEMGLTPEQTQHFYGKLGFGYLENVVEDGAVNDFGCGTFPGEEASLRRFYNRQFEKDGAIMSTPEVDQIANQLGRVPLFAQYGSEILRDWHFGRMETDLSLPLDSSALGRFSKDLHPEVREALDKTIGQARHGISTIPKFGSRDKGEILETRRERFRTIAMDLFPTYEELVKKDIDVEKLRQAYNEFNQKLKNLKDKQEQLQSMPAGSPGAGSLQQEIDDLKKELDPFSSLSPESIQEINQAIREEIQRQAQAFAKEIQGKIEKIKESQERQKSMQEELESLQSQQQGGNVDLEDEMQELQDEIDLEKNVSDALKQNLKDSVDNKLGGSQEGQELADEINGAIDEHLKENQQNQDNITDKSDQIADEIYNQKESEGNLPMPSDDLSDKAKDELQDAVAKLPEEKKDELEEKAKEELKKAEDTLNEAMRSQQNEDRAPTHSEQRSKDSNNGSSGNSGGSSSPNDPTEIDEDENDGSKKDSSDDSSPLTSKPMQDSEIDAQIDKARKARRAKLDPFQLAAKKWEKKAAESRSRLKRHLEREEDLEKETGMRSGVPNMQKAIQAKADPQRRRNVFERRTEPQVFDLAIGTLADRSSSMDGEKSQGAFDAVVYQGMTLEPLHIPNMVWEFADGYGEIKGVNESFQDPEVKSRVGSILTPSGGTNDALAINAMYEEMIKLPNQYKIIIILSDTGSGQGTALRSVINRIKEEKKVVLVHLGLGPHTLDTEGYYTPYSIGDLSMDKTGRERTFDKVYCEVLEDVMKHPDLYLQGVERAVFKK